MFRVVGFLIASVVTFGPWTPRCVAQEPSGVPEAALHAKLFSFPDPCKSAAVWFTPDGKKLLARTRTDRTKLSLNEVASGAELFSLTDEQLGNGTGQSVLLAPSADGKFFITSFEKTSRVWEMDTGKPFGKTLVHEQEVWSARLSKDNKRVLATTGNPARTRGDVQIWELASGKTIVEPITTKEPVLAIWSPDESNIMLLPSRKSNIVLWDAVKWLKMGEMDPRYRSGHFAADGKGLFAWKTEGDIRLFEAASREPLGEPVALARHNTLLSQWWRGVAFHPDGKSVLLIDGTKAILWDLSGAKPSKRTVLEHGIESAPYSVALSPDGKLAVIACTTMKQSPILVVWDVEKSQRLFQFSHGYVLHMAFSPDAGFLATVDTHQARLWSMKAGKGK